MDEGDPEMEEEDLDLQVVGTWRERPKWVESAGETRSEVLLVKVGPTAAT